MVKRISLFILHNPILSKFILFLILFVIISSMYLFFKGKKEEFDINNIPKPYNMVLSITDNTKKITNPIPNGFYTVTMNYDEMPTINIAEPTDFSLNEKKNIKYGKIIETYKMTIKIAPKNTNIVKNHYSDVFPQKFQIDYYFDPTCNSDINCSAKLKTDDINDVNSDFNPRININIDTVNGNNISSNQIGTISDKEYNNYGYIGCDTSNPYHYYVIISNPIDLKFISLTFNASPPKS